VCRKYILFHFLLPISGPAWLVRLDWSLKKKDTNTSQVWEMERTNREFGNLHIHCRCLTDFSKRERQWFIRSIKLLIQMNGQTIYLKFSIVNKNKETGSFWTILQSLQVPLRLSYEGGRTILDSKKTMTTYKVYVSSMQWHYITHSIFNTNVSVSFPVRTAFCVDLQGCGEHFDIIIFLCTNAFRKLPATSVKGCVLS